MVKSKKMKSEKASFILAFSISNQGAAYERLKR
jgi:hypothetical protein